MMAVANDTVPARIVLQIAVRRDEGRDLHLNGLRQETLRSRAQDRRQGILPKMTLDGEAQQLYPHSWRILSLWESATRHRQDTPPSIHRVTNFRV